MKTIYILITSLLLLCSCMVYRNANVSGGPLLNSRDKYVDVASGEASTVSVFGFGDYRRDDLILEAKGKLFKNRPLQKQEYYSNFSIGVTNKFILGIVHITKMIVTADVMSQKDSSNASPFSNEFTRALKIAGQQTYFKLGADTFNVGDIVYADVGDTENDFHQMEIISIDNIEVNLRYLDLYKSNVMVNYNKLNFFSTKKIRHGFKNGDEVKIISTINKDNTANGTVLGVNNKFVLVSSSYGKNPYLPERLKR